MEINGIKIAQYYFSIVSPDKYNFSRRNNNGYDAARKQFERLLKRKEVDKDAMREAIEMYKKEVIEQHNTLLNNLDDFAKTI